MRIVVLFLLSAFAASVQAGHGLMNAFADVSPLPAPGLTPANVFWRLDRLAERTELYFDATPTEQLARRLASTRERLAEVDLLLRQPDLPSASEAVHAYGLALDALLDANASTPALDSTARPQIAQELLEHQYLLAQGYVDLSEPAQRLATELMAIMQTRYATVRAGLLPGVAESFFFKEEEIRWSWEMAVRAHEVEQ
jgi:hypothetical protein